MTWAHFADEIETAAVATIAADATVVALAVQTVEVEPPQADGNPPEIPSAEMPYVGIRCGVGDSEIIGTRTLKIEHELEIRAVYEKNPTSDAYEMVQKVAAACCKALRGINGSSSWIASNHQVQVDKWSVGKPEIDAENEYLVECRATVPVLVIYPEA